MKIRLPTIHLAKRVLLAIAHRLGLKRPAKREEAVDFLEGAIEDAIEKVVDEHARREVDR